MGELTMMIQLTDIADRIRAGLTRRENGRAEWIEGTLDLAAAVSDARSLFTRDIDFGKWWNEQAFALNKNDRAALIQFGQNIIETKLILEQTDRVSYQHIALEWFPHVRKPDQPTEPKQPKQKKPTKAPNVSDKVLEIITAMDSRGEEIPSVEVLTQELGVSETPVRAAKYALDKIKEAQDDIVPDMSDAPKSWREETERFKRSLQKQQDLAYSVRIQEGVKAFVAEHVLPEYNKKLALYNAVIAARRGVITGAVYRQMLACLHPDQGMSEATRNTMFEIWKGLKTVLVSQAEAPVELSTLGSEFRQRRAARQAAKPVKTSAKKGTTVSENVKR